MGYATGQLKRLTAFKFEGYICEKRKQLVLKHGNDTKNAAHLIRLLRMGKEALREGTINVCRKGRDAEQLLDIKLGRWTLDEVKREYQKLKSQIDDAVLITSLPAHPNREAVNHLLTQMLSDKFLEGTF